MCRVLTKAYGDGSEPGTLVHHVVQLTFQVGQPMYPGAMIHIHIVNYHYHERHNNDYTFCLFTPSRRVLLKPIHVAKSAKEGMKLHRFMHFMESGSHLVSTEIMGPFLGY